MRRQRLLIAIAGAVVLALLAACGTGTGSGSKGASAPGGELRVAMGDDNGVLDPHVYTGNFNLLDMVYEPLVRYGEGGRIEPKLASSFKVSDDGLRVTFTLRQGVTFHDGTPFDADAVKWNFDRWVGKEDYSFFRTSEVISQVNVVDKSTVELVLSEPYPPLLQELSIVRPVRFLSPASVGPDGTFQKPVGTGPWTVTSHSPEKGATLVRYDRYWGKKPSIERVSFTVTPDSQTRASALRSGEVDLIGGGYLAPITPVEARQLQSAGGVQLLVGAPDTTVVVGFNLDGPLSDRVVRRAVGQAIDRDALNTALYSGFGQPARTLFPPSVPHSGDPVELRFDPAAARAALDEAGWTVSGDGRTKNGEPLALDLLVSSSPDHGQQDSRTTAQAVAAALEAVGMTVRIVTVDAAAYFDERNARKWDLTFFETYGAPYDPSTSAVSFLTAKGGGVPLWNTPELDGLVNTAIFARPADQDSAYQAIFSYLEEQVAFVPITYRPRFWAVGPDVKGFKVPVTEYDMDLSTVTLSR